MSEIDAIRPFSELRENDCWQSLQAQVTEDANSERYSPKGTMQL